MKALVIHFIATKHHKNATANRLMISGYYPKLVRELTQYTSGRVERGDPPGGHHAIIMTQYSKSMFEHISAACSRLLEENPSDGVIFKFHIMESGKLSDWRAFANSLEPEPVKGKLINEQPAEQVKDAKPGNIEHVHGYARRKSG